MTPKNKNFEPTKLVFLKKINLNFRAKNYKNN